MRKLIRQPSYNLDDRPFMIIWETTHACDLACRHCRAEAIPEHDPLSLETDQAKQLLEQVDSFGMPRPIFIFTGGDPFKRDDLFDLLAYGKATRDRHNVIIVVVNLDPYKPQEGSVELPLAQLDLKADETYQLHDLLEDKRYFWRGARNFVRLDPAEEAAHIFRLLRWSHREQDFVYFF